MKDLKHIHVWWTACAAAAAMIAGPVSATPSASSPLTVEEIRCKGTVLTTCDYVRGFVHIAPGSVLDEMEVQDARLRLSSLPAYASVRIYLDKGSAKGNAVVVVEVVEADRVENQYLAGTAARLSSVYQTLEGRVAEHDVFGTDATVNLDAQGIVPLAGPDHHGIYARLQLAKPTVLDCIECFVIAGVTYQNTVSSYPYGSFDNTDQFGIDWSAGYRLFDYSYVKIGYLARVTSQSVSEARGQSGLFSSDGDPNNNRGLSLGYGWDSEDDAYFPTRGSRLNVSVGFSWASIRFQKTWPVDPVSSWYFQLGGTPGSQYRASLNGSQDVSVGYQHMIHAGAFGGMNRGRWYVEPGYSYYGALGYAGRLTEIGLKAGLRLETKRFGVVDLYLIGSTAKTLR